MSGRVCAACRRPMVTLNPQRLRHPSCRNWIRDQRAEARRIDQALEVLAITRRQGRRAA